MSFGHLQIIVALFNVLLLNSFVTSQSDRSIFFDNSHLFRSLQTTRFHPQHPEASVIDIVELFILSSSPHEIENYLKHGSGQHRFAIDCKVLGGGFAISPIKNGIALQNTLPLVPDLPLPYLMDDLLVLARFKQQSQMFQPNNLLTITSSNKPLLSVLIADDRLIIEYNTDQQTNEAITVPVRIADDKWHTLVLHWFGGDQIYVWTDCQQIHKAVGPSPTSKLLEGVNWNVLVGVPDYSKIHLNEHHRRFTGLIEQLVVTRDRSFWQSDDQCRYQRETSSVVNSCPICTSPTLFIDSITNARIASVKTKSQLATKGLKLVEEFDVIREQLDAALRRIDFLERLQKPEEEIGGSNSGKCFDKNSYNFFNINDTWTTANCSKTCTCVLVNQKPRAICTPLYCSPTDIMNCPKFPFGKIVWNLKNGCCPSCQRKMNSNADEQHGRPCIRWHRKSSINHGTRFLIQLENDTCAEKMCIDGRETVLRLGPSSTFCSRCLNDQVHLNSGDITANCCNREESHICKTRSCELNSSTACDSPERAICEDTDYDIVCHCKSGFIGDGRRCLGKHNFKKNNLSNLGLFFSQTLTNVKSRQAVFFLRTVLELTFA